MKKEVISKCPVCQNELTITKLHCDHCQIEISGEFSLSRLNYLSKEQLDFVELFMRTQGNIKSIEKEMGVSYPTVKKILNEVLVSMGYDYLEESAKMSEAEEVNKQARQSILDKLASKEIAFDKAMELLKKLK